MNGPLEWYAAVSGIFAAFMIAGDFGRRVTGAGFALFVTASVAWIIAGWMAGTAPLVVQNAILLAINLYGVWQYWLSPRNRRKIAVQQDALDKAEARGEL